MINWKPIDDKIEIGKLYLWYQPSDGFLDEVIQVACKEGTSHIWFTPDGVSGWEWDNDLRNPTHYAEINKP